MRYACISGARSGIGEQFVKELDRLGYHCILIARRKDRLVRINEQLKHKHINNNTKSSKTKT
jgi:short-subunit dehydrogenase